MMKQILAGTAAVAAMAIATSAMADHPNNDPNQLDHQTYQVNVNITVAEEVSMWAGHGDVQLDMNGIDGNNTATFNSSITHINNVAASISVGAMSGDFAGGEIALFVLDGTYTLQQVSDTWNPAVTGPSANAGSWPTNHVRLIAADVGQPAKHFRDVAISPTTSNIPVTYAANATGSIPAPDDYAIVLNWQIAPDNI